LTDSDSWDWFPPPLTEATVAAIHRHLVARADQQIHLTRLLLSDHIGTGASLSLSVSLAVSFDSPFG
jgi:hypothetical protein